MMRRSALGAMVLAACFVVPAWAAERERTIPTRSFDRFELESDTGVGFWAEAGALYERLQDEETTFNNGLGIVPGNLALRSVTSFARFAYGGEKWEAGTFIPYSVIGGDIKGGGGMRSVDENGVGDVQLAAKYIPVRSDLLDFGGGIAASLPTGDYRRPAAASAASLNRLGAGEIGGTPFITGALHLAVVDVRAHFGAEFFYGSGHHGLANDRWVYGFGLFLPLGKYVSLRNEFSAIDMYDRHEGPKVVKYLPGIDFRLPIGNLDMLFRLTGDLAASAEAPSWGAGGSIVITSPTFRAPPAKGGVVIE